eukprot:6267520-Lingulodinium_polyedra.AAC.1
MDQDLLDALGSKPLPSQVKGMQASVKVASAKAKVARWGARGKAHKAMQASPGHDASNSASLVAKPPLKQELKNRRSRAWHAKFAECKRSGMDLEESKAEARKASQSVI